MPGQRLPDVGRDDDGPIPPRGRVIVADDDVLLREGLASLLTREGFEVLGQAGDGTRLLELVRQYVPDLAIVDVRMPPTGTTEGLQAASEIRRLFPSVAILVLSAYVEVDHALELLSSGDRIGYLLKTRVTDVAELIDAVERIAKGGSVIDPFLVQRLFAAHRRGDPLAKLSAREREVLALMAEGRSNAGIVHKLWIAEPTVEKHVHSILTKLCLPETDADHRRVLAVLAFLNAS
ncbi:response regulator transcription factor [Actinomadura sp. DC4]|uniref:response regulator transcription factor n=1 Tax=Actinomadura sp. DC4 TaxID=3055069 RepID=UPI0025B1A60B|nr:response regulator transcription factor [Actinomadura sp. DC4]MDN3351507.1 response regulator transcription factor [Actinomadura sp. DC4]